MTSEFNQDMFNQVLSGINTNLNNIHTDVKDVKKSFDDVNSRLITQEEKTENIELNITEIKELNKDCPVRLKRLKSNRAKYIAVIITVPILCMGLIYSSFELFGKLFGFIK